VIARWKGIIEEIHFGGSIIPLNIIENLYLEKPSFGPSKWPQKLKPAKNSKLPKLPENCFEPFGGGGWHHRLGNMSEKDANTSQKKFDARS
jgi:hypothetical protein